MDKQACYESLLLQTQGLLEGEYDKIANMANASALLYQNLENINWAGFYLFKNNELLLGPFQGKPACMHIPIGKGVCGTSAQQRNVFCVADVHEFPGHIACDSASKSEIVLPIIVQDTLLGVLDIDSPITSRFDEVDEHYLRLFTDLLVQSFCI